MKITLGRLRCLLLTVLALAGCGTTAAGPREPVLSVKVVQRAFATEGFHFRVRDPRKMLGAYRSRRWLQYSPVFFERFTNREPSALIITSDVWFSSWGTQRKAMRLPSGDQFGWCLSPASRSIWRAWLPSALAA